MIEISTTSEFSKDRRNKKYFNTLNTISGILIGLVIGISLTYVFMRDKHRSDMSVWSLSDSDQIQTFLLANIDPNRLSLYLKKLSKKPITGEHGLDENTLYIYNKWRELGLNTSFANYTVLMSYQNQTKPNSIIKFNKTGKPIHKSSPFEKPLKPVANQSEYYQKEAPFLAYSAATDQPVKGIPVYVNYGRSEDYEILEKLNISVRGHIVIARYGQIFRANIVKLAEDNGAIGAILYSDPYDYTDSNINNTYPESVYLPPTGVQRGTILLSDGDPQTPLYPSKDTAYRLAIEETDLPKIPAQPISYSDALHILSGLKQPKAPDNWTGKLNINYNIGPGYEDNSYITLEVNTYLKQNVIHNVIGIIKGCTEPDRFVIVGNHRDAWTFGAADPLSGTASLLEMSAAFASVMKTQHWCPRRSIVFCSWAAEEYGLLGSTEWVEENQKLLQSSAVAYINVDISVHGNYTFQADAVPLLYQTIFDATKVVSNPNPLEVSEGLKTVYESYQKHRPSNNSNPDYLTSDVPEVGGAGSGSDHSPFLQVVGIPVADIYYDCKKSNIKCYPLYHSMYETYEMMANLTDRGFLYHKAMTQIWTEMVRSLSDRPLLPLIDSLNTHFPIFLKKAINELEKSKFGDILVKQNISLGDLKQVIGDFSEELLHFHNYAKNTIDEQNVLELRKVNDIVMQLERAFIDVEGLPFQNQYKHILLAPSSTDSYASNCFAGLYNLLSEYRRQTQQSKQLKTLSQIRKHLSVIIFHINAAKLLLKQAFD